MIHPNICCENITYLSLYMGVVFNFVILMMSTSVYCCQMSHVVIALCQFSIIAATRNAVYRKLTRLCYLLQYF